MYQTILAAMQALVEGETVLDARDRRTGEANFQSKLHQKLGHLATSEGWAWRREEKFRTRALNKCGPNSGRYCWTPSH